MFFTANTSVHGVDYFWYINDSLVSEEIEPVLSFTNTGTNTLRMVAQNGLPGNFLTSEFEQTVEVTTSAFAYFTMPAVVKKGEEIPFVNKSARATKYLWDFGDDNTSEEETPAFAFAAAGEYTITLTVENGDGKKSTWTSDVTVIAPLFEELFNEDVNLPEGWSVIDGGTAGNTWNGLGWGGYEDHVSISLYYYYNTDGVDDWLVTPKITYDGEAVLTFDIKQDIFAGFDDFAAVPVSVKLSKTNAESGEDFTIEVGVINLKDDEGSIWVPQTFELSNYLSEGEEFHIGFHVNTSGAATYLDNVVVI